MLLFDLLGCTIGNFKENYMKFINVILALALALFSITAFAQAVNINTASVKELEALKGIGPAKAAAIVNYREENGPFSSVDDLVKVPGIKDKSLDKLLAANKDMLTAGEPEAAKVPVSSSAPAMPSASKTPEVPKAPEMPSASKTPEVPKAPAMPKVPEVPKVPVESPKQ